MSQKILDIYQSILEYSGIYIRDDGSLYCQLAHSTKENKGTDVIDLTIGGEPFVFPIKEQFSNPNQNKVYFHPFSENFLRGESEVIQTLREHIVTRLNYATAIVTQHLLHLLASPELHKNLTEEQIGLLIEISETDMTTVDNWVSIMLKIFKNKDETSFVKLYLKRSGTWKGESYSRLGVTSFPFYQEILLASQDQGNYSKLRIKDKANFRKIMEYIFPEIKKPEGYNYGTRTQIAPFLDTLMMTSARIATRLNEIIDIYKDFIPGYEALSFNMDWLPHFENLDTLRSDIRSMPELKGNAGVSSVQERQHPGQEYVQTPAPVAPAPPSPVAVTYHQPAVQAVPHVAQQPIQPTTPPVRANENGAINFGDVLRANPILATGPNPLAATIQQQQIDDYIRRYGVMPPMMQQMQHPLVPTWAQPQGNVVPGFGQPQQMQGYQQNTMPGMGVLPPTNPPPPGHQWVFSPQHGQFIPMPLQQQPMYPQQPMQGNGGIMPPGWAVR